LRVGFLGCGHIASALAEGWARPELPAEARPELFGYDIRHDAAEHFSKLSGATAVASAEELVDAAEMVLVAVRPPEVQDALAGVRAHLRGHPVISVAASVTVPSLLAWLPEGAKVGRVIPNVAVAMGHGLLVWTDGTLGDSTAEMRALFALLGDIVEVPEHLFDQATVVAGCGPGFTALFIEAFEEAGVAVGLDWETASQLALGAVEGTVELVRRSGDTGGVRRAVSTPGGMTIAGIEQLELARLRPALMAAVRAAVSRGRGEKS
jgi:pyrroline-5-carboxylate reductase